MSLVPRPAGLVALLRGRGAAAASWNDKRVLISVINGAGKSLQFLSLASRRVASRRYRESPAGAAGSLVSIRNGFQHPLISAFCVPTSFTISI